MSNPQDRPSPEGAAAGAAAAGAVTGPADSPATTGQNPANGSMLPLGTDETQMLMKAIRLLVEKSIKLEEKEV